MSRDRGALSLLLHCHMPYVEGFGTWPFGEEWLWEAIASSYVPLLDVLDGAAVTVGLTPVLCDQLETLTGPAGDRLEEFLTGIRAEVHAEDAAGLERGGHGDLAAEIRRAAGDYVRAHEVIAGCGGDLLGAFGALDRVELWSGPATHAVLPLLATRAGLHLQLACGLASHERRFGVHAGGVWLPECAYEPGIERELAEHGARTFCVDQTSALGLGSFEHLEPIATEAGPVAVPVDWQTVALVWDERGGYPSAPEYRDTHRRTHHDLMPWANGGGRYDPADARARAREDARDFVGRAAGRLDDYTSQTGRPGLLCCALDAELLGHWWYEGPTWLAAVIREADAAGLELATVSQALDRVEPVRRRPAASTWGQPKDLSTWDSPAVAERVFDARDAELRLTAAAAQLAGTSGRRRSRRHAALERAARELLALQASDWAFQLTRCTAGDYPLRRAEGHRLSIDVALRALEDCGAEEPDPSLRNLAPDLDLSPLAVP